MIKIYKDYPPLNFYSADINLAIEKMEFFYNSKNRNQKRYQWPFNKDIDRYLKEKLHGIFHGKCGYCEIKIKQSYMGTIDRYRPHNGVREKNEYFQDLYWWLAFDWNNLIYSCKECNQYKANYFPINGKRALNITEDITIENPLLLNPCSTDPANHLTYDNYGIITPLSDEGFQTIELLRLNRNNLVDSRINAKEDIINLINRILNNSNDKRYAIHSLLEIYENGNPNIEFLAYKQWVLRNELDITPFLGEILGLEEYQTDEYWIDKNDFDKNDFDKNDFITSDYFPIEYVHIKNFKSIDDLRIDFKEDKLDKKSWLFLLGENGVGKSSILQAMAIGLKLDKNLITPLIPSLVKKGKRTAEIILKERNSTNTIITKLIRKNSSFEQSGDFASYLICYGSLRLSVDEIDGSKKRDTSKVSYENLFKPTKALNDVTKWLKAINKGNPAFFDRIAYSIKQLLPHDYDDNELKIEGDNIILGSSEKLFSELSDGFKSTITLALDIMMKLSDAQSDMDKMSGIVLIDELGNQLHPRWQMRIVKQLREVFPNINFIISTHHPLCLRGADKEEVLLLRNINNEIITTKELPDSASLRVDQILASEFFGLNSLVDPDIEANFNRYYQLVAKNERATEEEKSELLFLKDELRNKQQLGTSLREEIMYTVIDKLLAEEVIFNKNPLERSKLKEEAVKRVRTVWENLNLDRQ